MRRLSIFLVLLCLTGLQSVEAREEILSFDSQIDVQSDGRVFVTESMKVKSEARNIRRGIYRDFPTKYKDRLGNTYRVDFNIISVRRDGKPENYHTENRTNGVRVYFGSENVFLKPDEYTYEFKYQTSRQIGFFTDFDELYWNVTGDQWAFPIRHASAILTIPQYIPHDKFRLAAYTGPYGSREQDYRSRVEAGNQVFFETLRTLSPGEGLTIAVGWPKGLVIPPTTTQKLTFLLADNLALLVGSIGLLLLLTYYILVWRRVGKDVPGGVIFPRYVPPPGYTPASMRFIREMEYDHKCFATALVNLAVKGILTIREGTFDFEITRNTNHKQIELAPGEHAILRSLVGVNQSITLSKKNHTKISSAIKAHKNSLKRNYEKIYFVTNFPWFLLGIVLTALFAAATLISLSSSEVFPGTIFVGAFLAGAGFHAARSIKQLHLARVSYPGFLSFVTSIFVLVVSMTIIFGIFILAYHLQLPFSAPVTIFLALLVLVNLAFYQWLKAPTRAGRALLDKIEGFRLYLDVAEKDDLNLKNPPNKTPDLFEMYLPFALALGVEQAWMEQFAGVFAEMERNGQAYHPEWYYGDSWDNFDSGRFGRTLSNSLSNAISASATPPGSSSGSGGGGFSGGGGGGGGGGGW